MKTERIAVLSVRIWIGGLFIRLGSWITPGDPWLPDADELSISELHELQAFSLKPSDVIICRSKDFLSPEQKSALNGAITDVFPGHKFIVLEHGFSLQFVSPEEAS